MASLSMSKMLLLKPCILFQGLWINMRVFTHESSLKSYEDYSHKAAHDRNCVLGVVLM